jgi:phosphoglycolate phosphatase
VVQLVLFDVDGTLIHSKGAGVKAFERAFASEFHISHGTESLKFAGRTDPSIVRDFFQQQNIEPSPENFRRFFETYVFWLDYMLRKTEGGICAGIWNFIHGLQSLSRPPVLGLLTGNIRLGAEIKLRHFYLWDHFTLGVFGDDHEDRNQLAAIALRLGRERIGPDLDGSRVVVVGDTPLDIECAKAIQAKSLAVATGGASLEVLKNNHPTWVVQDLLQVSAEEICGQEASPK